MTVTSEGAWQKNVSGEGEEQPSFKINSDLRLDLAVTVFDAVLGGKVLVPTLGGAVVLSIPKNTSSGPLEVFRVTVKTPGLFWLS